MEAGLEHFGWPVLGRLDSFEVDVSTYDLDSRNPDPNADSGDGGPGTLTLVSVRQANLYADLLNLLGRADPALSTTPYLYAVTLRSRKPPKRRQLLDAWFYPI